MRRLLGRDSDGFSALCPDGHGLEQLSNGEIRCSSPCREKPILQLTCRQ